MKKLKKTFIDLSDNATIRQLVTDYDPLEEVSDEQLREVASEIGGEPVTGYEDPADGEDLGDFNCRNCKYASLDGALCGQSLMKKYSQRPRTADGSVIVNPLGCCEFVHRTGTYFQGIKRPK